MYTKIPLVLLLIILPIFCNAKSCKKYNSCYEVILDYPTGNFGGKDRDKDGIPCENVCHSKQEVKNLLKKLQYKRNNNK